MSDHSSIHGNSAGGLWGSGSGGQGGGVFNTGQLVMRDHSSIHGNTTVMGWVQESDHSAGQGGGIYNVGTVVIRGSAVIRDNATDPSDPDRPDGLRTEGGGIYNAKGGTLVGVTCAPTIPANVFGNSPDDCYFAE